MRERSTVDRLREHLLGDFTMVQCLTRGVLSFRNSARWLQDNGFGDCSEESLVSGLRRWVPCTQWTMADAWACVEDAVVSVKERWFVFDVARTYESTRQLTRLQQGLAPEDQAPAMYGRHTIRLAVRQGSEQRAREVLGFEAIQREFHDVVRIGLHRGSDDPVLPIATTIGARAYGHEPIEVLGFYGLDDECSMFVPRSQARRAYHIASEAMRT